MPLTRTQERIFAYLSVRTVLAGGIRCTKRDLAQRVQCTEKTVDRAIVYLRSKNLVEVQPCYLDNGRQVGNLYRVPFNSSVQA